MGKKGNVFFNFLLNVVFVFIIVVAAAVTIISLNTKEKGVANVNGFIPFSIQSESMEKTILKGDLIVTKKVDTTNLKENDVISFFAIEQNVKIIKTHRIIEVKQDGPMTYYVTKGDNNELADAETVAPGDVIAVYDGIRVPKVGYALDFFRSKYGFLIGIILPIFIFFIYQLYIFIELVIEYKNEQNGNKSKRTKKA